MRIRVQLVLAEKARVDFASALSTESVSAQVKERLHSCGEQVVDRLGVDDDFIVISGLQVGEHIGDLSSVMRQAVAPSITPGSTGSAKLVTAAVLGLRTRPTIAAVDAIQRDARAVDHARI